LPQNLQSAAQLLSGRSNLETSYLAAVAREIVAFSSFLVTAAFHAVEGAQMPSPAQIEARWEESVERLNTRFPDSATLTRTALGNAGVDVIAAAAVASVSLARSAAGSPTEARRIVRVAMGRSTEGSRMLP